MYDWNDSLSKFRNDISEYLKKRYKNYCNYIGEEEIPSYSYNDDSEIIKRHKHKKNELIKFGLFLREKLEFFLDESRNELFKNIIEDEMITEKFFKSKFDKLNTKLSEEYNYKRFSAVNDFLNRQITMKLQLLKQCESMKDNRFIKSIDERRTITEKRMLEEDKRQAEEKIIKERAERRQGLLNVKPISFYNEMYLNEGAPFKYFNNIWTKYKMLMEFDYDVYFQKYDKSKGKWVRRNRLLLKDWTGDASFSDEESKKYILTDNLDDNQKFLDRCNELVKILLILKDSENHQLRFFQIEILQKYLTKRYLITRQIAWINKYLKRHIIKELSTDPYNRNIYIKNHPSQDYDFSVYKDDFNITKIKEDVDEFIRVNEKVLFTPFECLKVYLKKHNNRITKKQHAEFTGKSLYVASKELEKFKKERKLKSKIEDRGLNVFYV